MFHYHDRERNTLSMKLVWKDAKRQALFAMELLLPALLALMLASCGTVSEEESVNMAEMNTGDGMGDLPAPSLDAEETAEEAAEEVPRGELIVGTEDIRGFLFVSVYYCLEEDPVHFGLHIPESYDGSEPYAFYVTLPGYDGMYYQGLGKNVTEEDFGTEALRYQPDMIIAAPQFADWDETTARQVLELTHYFLEHYSIDPDRVYISGFSGGGETAAMAVSMEPELFTACLNCSSCWVGDLEPVAEAETGVYMIIGDSDRIYGTAPVKETYETLTALYRKKGLDEERINQLVVLDIKDQAYFDERKIEDQHGGGICFAHDEAAMGWLFGEHE